MEKTGPHAPSVPLPFLIALHASQGPWQVVSQQKPSTHSLLEHWLPAVQAEPTANSDTQWEPSQKWLLEHSMSLAQAVAHAPVTPRQAWARQFVPALAAQTIFFYPEPMFDDVAILLVIASFGVGALLSAAATGLRRLVVSRKLMDDSVHAAACARFVDQGISATRCRTGVLVYVSLFERRVEIVPDIGIPVDRLGDRWTQGVRSIDAAPRQGVEPFVTALQALWPLLAEAVPRAAEDVNELPDDMVQA